MQDGIVEIKPLSNLSFDQKTTPKINRISSFLTRRLLKATLPDKEVEEDKND